MTINRRKTRRFDRPFFVQFRQLEGLSSYSLGLTSNISSDGFCFQFQNIKLEHGENLEFKFNNLMTNQSVQFFGDVMWIQKREMKYNAGIRFRMSNKKNRKNMSKIISDFFSIPVDQLSYRHNKRYSEHKRRKKVDSEPDRMQGKRSSSGTHIIKRGMKICLNLVIITMITVVFVLFMPEITEHYERLTKIPVTPDIQTTPFDNSSNETSKSKAVVQIRDAIIREHNKSEKVFFTDKKDVLGLRKESSNESEKEEAVEPTRTQTTQGASENFKFYVQVTSPYDHDYAYNMLIKIKNYYPDAFLFKINDYYKIRIPGITSEKQGAEVNKDLEEKLGIKSVLVYRLNYN